MKFGVFYQAPEAPGQSAAQRYTEMFELIQYAETLGFDHAWLAELHFGGAFSLLANPMMMVPVIAERTKRIRIGTAVTLLPFQHPLSCAEMAATADVLSGGRFEFGVGRGSISSQFHGFRVPIEENRARFDEALEIIRLAWTTDRFSYKGRFWDIEELTVVPRPAQQPHPPIRVAVHTAESFAHLADKGLPIYSGTTTTPLPALREYMATYRQRFAAAGHVWQPEQMALMLPVYLGDRDAMRPGVQRYYKNLETIFAAIPDSYGEHLPRLKTISENAAHPPFEKFCRDNAAFGDTADVIDRLQQVRDEFSLSQIICWIDQGNMLARRDVERVMRELAERVMPKVA